MFEKPKLKLLGKHPCHRRVEKGVFVFVDVLVPIRITFEVNVYPSLKGHEGSFGGGGSIAVVGMDALDAVEVGDDGPTEPPLPTEQVGDKVAVGGTGHALHAVVTGHHLLSPCLYGHPEGDSMFLKDGAPTLRGLGTIHSTLGTTVCNQVLQRAVGSSLTHTAHHLASQRSCQQGVFSQGLLYPAPTRVTGKVEHRSETEMGSPTGELTADGLSHAVQKLGIPRRSLSQSCREYRSIGCHHTMGRLLAEQEGYAQAGILDGKTLQEIGHSQALIGIESRLECLP